MEKNKEAIDSALVVMKRTSFQISAAPLRQITHIKAKLDTESR